MDSILNFVRNTDTIASAGQPTAEQFGLIAEAGYESVVNLATSTHRTALPNEGQLVIDLGLTYVHLPVPWDSPEPDHVRKFSGFMRLLAERPTFVHCAMNYRATAFIYLYLRHFLGYSENRARSPILDTWEPDDTWNAVLSWSAADIGA